jgi:hypothetical protein
MKKILFFFSIALIIGACATQKTNSTTIKETKKIEVAINDSIEYRLVTFDPAFDTWFLRYKNKGEMRSVDYYKDWNRRYIIDWNTRANSSSMYPFFDSPLFIYPMEIDDLAIQHQLFYYFQYVEYKLKTKILFGYSPRAVY